MDALAEKVSALQGLIPIMSVLVGSSLVGAIALVLTRNGYSNKSLGVDKSETPRVVSGTRRHPGGGRFTYCEDLGTPMKEQRPWPIVDHPAVAARAVALIGVLLLAAVAIAGCAGRLPAVSLDLAVEHKPSASNSSSPPPAAPSNRPSVPAETSPGSVLPPPLTGESSKPSGS